MFCVSTNGALRRSKIFKIHGVLAVAEDIIEISIALLCSLIPPKHEIDSLRNLRTTSLINAAGIDPDPTLFTLERELAAFLNLDPAWSQEIPFLCHGLGSHFSMFPSVQQNGVTWNTSIEELMEFQSGRIQ